MKKILNLHRVEAGIKYAIYVVSVAIACYGFWGCLFPDLTLVDGTYRFVADETYDRTEYGTAADEMKGQSRGAVNRGKSGQSEGTESEQAAKTHEEAAGKAAGIKDAYAKDTEQLYADILDGKIKVTFRSKFLELFRYKRGFEK